MMLIKGVALSRMRKEEEMRLLDDVDQEKCIELNEKTKRKEKEKRKEDYVADSMSSLSSCSVSSVR